MRKMFLLPVMILITASFLITNPLLSVANVRIEVTSGTGIETACPFYARIEPEGGVIHTDEWAAIPFYRDPDCVPGDFNLLDFFDIPRVWECESFMAGHEVWENPDIDIGPIQCELKAVGPMPIYFVPWEVLQAVLEDGVLTVPELESLDGVRIGIAAFYTETLHPYPAAQQPKISIVARGFMKDNGDKFELKAVWINEKLYHPAKIEFKNVKAAPALKSRSNLATTWGEMKRRN